MERISNFVSGFTRFDEKSNVPSTFAAGVLKTSMKTSYAFSRRGPDRVTEALVGVLSVATSYEFKALFSLVYADLKARNAASGGEEMLRLRAYEKLQNLVQTGAVKKIGKEYRGVPASLAALLEVNAAPAAAVVVEGVEPLVPAPAAKKRRKSSAIVVS